MQHGRWTIKVTSKGQITLPKEARDMLLVREGDSLDAWLRDDSLVLQKREEVSEAEKLVRYARARLQTPSGEIMRTDARALREQIGQLPVDMTTVVREGRQSR